MFTTVVLNDCQNVYFHGIAFSFGHWNYVFCQSFTNFGVQIKGFDGAAVSVENLCFFRAMVSTVKLCNIFFSGPKLRPQNMYVLYTMVLLIYLLPVVENGIVWVLFCIHLFIYSFIHSFLVCHLLYVR